MAKLNDEAVVQYYQQKKQALTDELQKIDTVLSALNGKAATPAPKKRKYTRRTPVAAQTPAPKAAKAAPARKAAASPAAAAKPKQSSKPSQAAKPVAGGTWDSKIQSALTKIGTADKDRLVQHIAAKDPASSEKVRKALTLRLAVMEKNGKLKKDQSGDSLQYRLP